MKSTFDDGKESKVSGVRDFCEDPAFAEATADKRGVLDV